MSSIICGSQIPAIDDEFNVADGLDEETQGLSNRQKAELNSIQGMGNRLKDSFRKKLKKISCCQWALSVNLCCHFLIVGVVT